MLLKHDIEIRSAKTWLDSDAQPEMYNEGCFGDLWNISYLPKTGGWRTTPPAVVGTGVWGRSPQPGASPTGGRGGNVPRFSFLPPRFISCAPTVFFGEEKVADFGRKKRLNFWIRPEKAFGFRRRPFFFLEITWFSLKLRPNPIQQ